MRKALLLIDIQNDYFPGGKMELAGINEAALQAQALLAEFRRRRWPTYHIQHVSTRQGAPFFVPETPGVEIHASILPLPGKPSLKSTSLTASGIPAYKSGWLPPGCRNW